MWYLFVCALLLIIIYLIFIKRSKYWERKGIPGPKPLPFVGNIGGGIIGLRHVSEIYSEIYRNYEDCPFVGVYRMGEPCLLIRDPEIVKNILIKDFHHFSDNDILVDEKLDPLLGRNLFVLKGEEWKKARQFVAPNFATGKIKAVFPLVENVSTNLITYLEKQENLALNAKEVYTKYNCDVVAICGFGVEGNSFENSNSVFINLAKKFSAPGSWQGVRVAISLLLPKLVKMKFIPKSFDDGVITLTKETLKYRLENGITRSDFFDAVSQSHDPNKIAAYLGNLILDGFETSSTVMTWILYELSLNPECQSKLRKEINDVLTKSNGQLTYEAIQDMSYLDACVSETLRVHPALSQMSKTCTIPYTIKTLSSEFRNLSVTVDKGSSILVPLFGMHMDPKYFSSPEKYMPERFLDKSESLKHVFMPFGSGPRMCIGSRFGLMQVKIGIAQTIRNFEITLNEKTLQPLKYDPFYFILYPKGGFWFNCKKI